MVTYYDLGSGERTELSAVTLGNWADKTSNLLRDELDATEGDRLALALAVEAPGHWLTAVWQLACWQVGVSVDLTDPCGELAVVTGRDYQPYVWREVYACALDPMGFGFGEPLPAGVKDYAVEVRSQPDTFTGPPPDPSEVAWVDSERTLTQADLVAIAAPRGRWVLRPGDPWTTCRDGIIAALLSGGSVVMIAGEAADGDAPIGRISQTERAVMRPGAP